MKNIFILTGDSGSGKTTWLMDLIGRLRDAGLSVAGIAAPAVPRSNRSYDLLDLVTGKSLPLASESPSEGWERTGRFYFNPKAISLGKKILTNPDIYNNDLLVVDEVGPFELEGKIWADAITAQSMTGNTAILWVVRRQLLAKVTGKWDLKDPVILDVSKHSVNQGKDSILGALKK